MTPRAYLRDVATMRDSEGVVANDRTEARAAARHDVDRVRIGQGYYDPDDVPALSDLED